MSQTSKIAPEIKIAAVEDYLESDLSKPAVCEKQNFSQPNSGGAICMAKGRKTSLEERIEIVSHCIANNKDYGKTIEQYSVSYQQIYAWVRKYESGLLTLRSSSMVMAAKCISEPFSTSKTRVLCPIQ